MLAAAAACFRCFFVLALALGISAAELRSPSAADGRKFEGKAIRSITFSPAGQPLPVAWLLRRLPFHAGTPFHIRQLPDAIQALYATGRFTQISIDARDSGGGVALTLITTPAFFVGHVAIHGIVAPPNQDQLLGAAKLRLGTPFDPADLSGAVTSMIGILRNNGFYAARVDTQSSLDQTTGLADIEFFLHPGKRARYGQPAFGADPGLPAADLTRASHWQRVFGLFGWDYVTDARTRQGLDYIRRLYDRRGLLEADIGLDSMRYLAPLNLAEPVLSIAPGPRVDVTVTGLHLSAGELRQLLPIYQERRVDSTLLDEGAQSIQQYLQSQGFFGAQVSYKQDADRLTDSTAVIYTVVRGPRRRFVFLGVHGNRYFTTATIRERLAEQPASFPRYPHGRFSDVLLQDDIRAIQNLYADNGFRDAKVSSRVVESFAGRPGHLAVILGISEGPQSRVASLTIEGPQPSDIPILTRMCSSIKGQPFSATDLATDREALLNYYYDLGYPNPSFETSVTFTSDNRDALIKYSIVPGPRKFVNQVIVSGLQTTRRNLVLDRIELRQGDPLSLTKQNDSQRNLYNLGVFARVNSAIQNPGGDEDDKNVLIDIDEAKHYSFNAGVGAQLARIGGSVTTLDNPAGTTGFSPRVTLGITRDNFFGLGQRVGFQTALSTIEQRGTATYFIPQFASNPNLSLTTVALIDNSNDIRTYTAQRREASVQLGQRVSRAFTFQYRLLFRHVTVSNIKIDQLLIPLLSQPETVGMAEVSLIEDKRDDPTDSHHGTYTTLDLGYAPSFLGSQTQFGRFLSRNSSYYQLTRDLVLARSTQFGFITRTGGKPEIPLAERLYSGGSTSIRAFPDFQAGPRDLVTGFPLGGNALFINNVELRFPLYGDNINGVLFQDAGNVYSSLGNFSLGFRQENLQNFNYMIQDVGFGIRYRTPIGPIRVDLSLSPDAPRFFGLKGTFQDYLNGTAPATVQKINAFQFHISLGQAF